MIYLRHSYLLAAVPFAIEAFSSNILAESYQADGRMTYAVINEHGGLDTNCYFSFKIWVDGCKWFIQTIDEKREDIKPYEDSYDGKYVYALTTFLDKSGKAHPSGIIESNNVPQESSFYAFPIWAALGSACYFEEITNSMFQPIWHLSDISIRNKRFSVIGKLIKHNIAPFLPEKVFYYNDGKIYFKDNYGNSRIGSYPSPYNNGFMDAEYTCFNYTNVDGIALPKHFTFTRYMPRQGGASTNETSVMCAYDCVVTNVSIQNDKREYSPTIIPPVYVDDRRFGVAVPSIISIQYRATNSWWPSATNPVVLKLYKEKASIGNSTNSAQPNPPKPWVTSLIWCILLCSSIFFVFLLFRGIQKREQ